MASTTLEKARGEAEVSEPEVVTERPGGILRVQINRPAKKNAMTVSMYAAIADLLNAADKDDGSKSSCCMAREIRSRQATIWVISRRTLRRRGAVRRHV